MTLFGEVLAYLGTGEFWIAFTIGVGLATVVGIIPGIGSVSMMAIIFPYIIINVHDPAIAIVILAAITGTSNTFDSIPAQLMGIVSGGTQVTFLEGHQLARKGLGAFSIGAVYAVSAIGGLVGAFVLLLAIPVIRPFILSFSFGEITALGLFGLAMVSVLSHGAMIKGLISGLFGLLLGTVGVQAYSGVERLTFGNYELTFGLPVVALLLGIFAIPEMIDLAITREPVAANIGVVSRAEVFRGFREGLRRWKMAVRMSALGAALGAIPGLSTTVVTWTAYAVGMAGTKDKSQFGKGSLDGLLFAESAENAKEGGQAIPTMVLGIPASTSWLLVLVAMLAYGIAPGPTMLTKHSDIIGLVIVTLALGNLVCTMLGLLVTHHIVKLTRIPYPAIAAVMVPVVIVSAYIGEPATMTLLIVLAAAPVGIALKHFGWPRPPFAIALVLGSIIEDNLWTSISVHGVIGTLTRPLTLILIAVAVVVAIVLNRAMSRSQRLREQTVAIATEADATIATATAHEGPDDVDRTTVAARSMSGRKLYWRREHLVPGAFLLLGLFALNEALGYGPPRAAVFPLLISGFMVALSIIQLWVQARSPAAVRGQIMDIGMRSTGMVGSGRSSRIMVLLLGAFVLATILVGLKISGLLFALLMPMALMTSPMRTRLLTSIVAFVLVALFIYGVGDGLLHLLWPKSIFVGR